MGTPAVLGEILELASFTCCFSKNLPGFGSLFFSPSPPPILHMKGAMEEATGPNAEPPALFLPPLVKLLSELVFLFGFYLTVSKPRPHTKNAQTMQINRKTVNVCTVGMVVYKRIVVDLILKFFAFKLFYLFFLKVRILTWRSTLCIYLFIYLVPFQLRASTAAAIFSFLLSSSDLGTF